MKLFKMILSLTLALALLGGLSLGVYATEEENTQNAPAEDAVDVTFTETNEVVYATTNVNVRSGPGVSYERIGMLTYGQSIVRTGLGDNGWSRVLYQGRTAYMSSMYLSTESMSKDSGLLDDSGLMKQIAIANGLRQGDYTTESWQVLTEALSEANLALKGSDQKRADQAEADLKSAIAGLTRVDFTGLENALARADGLLNSESSNGLWGELMDAIAAGKEARNSGDQAAADAAAQKINDIAARLEAMLESGEGPEVVVQEVEVEVPPTDDFCNIPSHRLWPVLFFISLALNIGLAAVILIYISKKKRIQRDDTPLVDYDIDDDNF